MDEAQLPPDFLRGGGVSGAAGSPARIVELDADPGGPAGRSGLEGVRLLTDFLSPAEAEALLERVEATAFVPAQSGKGKQHFGPRVNFNKRRIRADRFEGLPGYAAEIEGRARRRLSVATRDDPKLARALASYRTTDVFVLRYEAVARSNLDFHVDDLWAYDELILDLSLESDGVLSFLRRSARDDGTGPVTECVRVPLPARSLAVLYGPARRTWEHAILAEDVRGRRTSLTFRSLAPALRESEGGRLVMARAGRVVDEAGSAPVLGDSG